MKISIELTEAASSDLQYLAGNEAPERYLERLLEAGLPDMAAFERGLAKRIAAKRREYEERISLGKLLRAL